jgi:O-antigen/teichoic acid export membrane protein
MPKTNSSDLGGLMRQGLTKSLASLMIKVATAGLTYLMFVVLSRSMGATDYGYFAFGLSVATVLAIGASMGQQTAVLRFFPEERVAGRPEKAAIAVRAGVTLTLLAGAAVGLGLIVVALGWNLGSGQPVWHFYAAATLILPLAVAEYMSSALRAQGSVWTGLVPRDILWRLVVPVIVLALWALGIRLEGSLALILTAAVLTVMLVLQYLLGRRLGYEVRPTLAGLAGYWRAHGTASRWFLMGTVIDSAAVNVDTILVGLLVAAASAGVYFNAARTAGLMTLFTFAIALVVAPMLAEHYHAGHMRKAQAITSLCAWAGFLFSAAVFAGFWFYGDTVLAIFGNRDPQGWWVLIILSVGYLFEAATGPARMVMVMTGRERAYVWIWGAALLAGIAVQAMLIPLYGAIAAALVNTTVRIFAFGLKTWWARRTVGLDPSLFGVLQIAQAHDREDAGEAVGGLA